jgi:acyl-CoA reductase-like NAD-dependent aldehyde dehydrogenase
MTAHAAAPPLHDLDPVLGRLRAGEHTWAATSLAGRRRLLLDVQAAVAEHAAQWVETAAGIKGLPAHSPLTGEEWISGPWATIAYTSALAETLAALDEGRDPLANVRVTTAPGGRVALDVLPHSVFDRLLLSGFSAQVWTRPEADLQEVRASAGLWQRHPADTAGTALVLGAGNIFSIAPLDVLYQLYADNRVAVLKLNPVTEPLLPVYRRVFAPLIDRGFVAIVTGGPDVGAALACHPDISAVHMTGSEATHDAIVWGTGEQGAAAKAAGTPLLDKPITSELGGVSPVIVVPGRWSRSDIRFQAWHVATQRLHNSGFNCVASQIVVVSKDWPQKNEFLRALRAALAQAPARPAWYPGAADRVQAAREHYPAAFRVGGTPERTLISGLDLTDPQEQAFSAEYFAPVLGLAEIPGTGARFLNTAVQLVNTNLRGTLGANIIIDPASKRQLGGALRNAIAELRYGTIAVNAWTGVGYLTPRATWGAFPGHDLTHIQSGRGVVHNALLLSGTERTVVTGPFRPSPRSLIHGEASLSPLPPWFVNNKTAATTGRRLTAFADQPHWRHLPPIFASALRG